MSQEPLLAGAGLLPPATPIDALRQRLLQTALWLRETQWWDPDRLERFQLECVAALLAHARRTVPYYQSRLADLDWREGQPVDLALWRTLPVLGRRDVQQAGRSLLSTALPGEHGPPYEDVTSGSTGMPLRIVGTEHLQVLRHALSVRRFEWWERDLSLKLASSRTGKGLPSSASDGLRFERWDVAMGAFATGPMSVISATTEMRRQVEWLAREQPDYLVTHPANLAGLLECAAEQGVRPTRLRHVGTFAESLAPAVRARCEAEWGVPVLDTYSAEEAGTIAAQCPRAEHYHVQSESVLVEVLDERGDPCAPGETGRVVVTPLANFAMPLLRYDIGDLAVRGDPCACGRGLPVLARVHGRARHILRTHDGGRYWPTIRGSLLAEIAPVTQFQVVQRSFDLIEPRLVVSRPVTGDEEQRMRACLLERLPARFAVEFSYPDHIERSADGSYLDFASDLEPPGT